MLSWKPSANQLGKLKDECKQGRRFHIATGYRSLLRTAEYCPNPVEEG